MKFFTAAAALLGAVSSQEIMYQLSKQDYMYTPDMITEEGNSCMRDTDLIKQGEGYRACMYHDTMGIPTICYGYNLKNANARSEVAAAGGNYDDMMKGGCTTQSVCNKLLQTYVSRSESYARSIFGSLSCSYAQAVAVDMTYNLGESGMRSFNTFDSLMRQGKYKEAAADGRHTAWCGQVGGRCSRDMGQLENCC